MGLRSSAMACQPSTSAVTWILNRRGLSASNYLDDFIGVSPPTLATTHFHELGVLLYQLGLDESVAKSCPPSPVMTVWMSNSILLTSLYLLTLLVWSKLRVCYTHGYIKERRTTTKSSRSPVAGRQVGLCI